MSHYLIYYVSNILNPTLITGEFKVENNPYETFLFSL